MNKPMSPNVMKNSLFALFILVLNQNYAQQFKAETPLSKIKVNGLHAALVSSDIRSISKANLSDIRLFGKNNVEVPYYFWQENCETANLGFTDFPVVSKIILPNKSTTVIVENKNRETRETREIIEELVLNIANSKLEKICDISGSDDQNQWFGLLDKYLLSALENSVNTSVFVSINLPLSSYRYFKFKIDDTKTAPIDLLQIGRYTSSSVLAKFTSVKSNSVSTQTNSAEKKTEIQVKFANPQALDKLDFQISKPNLFKRNARILVKSTTLNERSQEVVFWETVFNFELNSTQPNTFVLPGLFEKEVKIEIDNEDNPPLEIKQVNFSQIPVYIVADLLAGEAYVLKTGNNQLFAPKYDIAHFKIDNIATLPTASFSALTFIETKEAGKNQSKSFWQEKWFLWLCIGIAGTTIAYFSSTLLKDLRKE